MAESSKVSVISKDGRVVEEVVVVRTATGRAETIADTVRRTGMEAEEAPGATANGTAKL